MHSQTQTKISKLKCKKTSPVGNRSMYFLGQTMIWGEVKSTHPENDADQLSFEREWPPDV